MTGVHELPPELPPERVGAVHGLPVVESFVSRHAELALGDIFAALRRNVLPQRAEERNGWLVAPFDHTEAGALVLHIPLEDNAMLDGDNDMPVARLFADRLGGLTAGFGLADVEQLVSCDLERHEITTERIPRKPLKALRPDEIAGITAVEIQKFARAADRLHERGAHPTGMYEGLLYGRGFSIIDCASDSSRLPPGWTAANNVYSTLWHMIDLIDQDASWRRVVQLGLAVFQTRYPDATMLRERLAASIDDYDNPPIPSRSKSFDELMAELDAGNTQRDEE